MDNCTDCGASNASHAPACGAAHRTTTDDIHDLTRTTAGGFPESEAPVLILDDGQRIGLGAPVILGRAPRGETGARSIAVADPQRIMSKTHLRLDGDGPGVTVTDLNSTNGARVTLPDGRDIRLVPGAPTMVMAGTRIQIGERTFWIADAPARSSGPTETAMGGAAPAVPVPEQARPLETAPGGDGAGASQISVAPWPSPQTSDLLEPANSGPAGGAVLGLMEEGVRDDSLSPADPVSETAARIEAQLQAAAQAVCARIDPAFHRVAVTAIGEVVDAISSRRITIERNLKPGLVPAYVLERTDGRSVGEAGTARLRRDRTHPAILVGLHREVLLAFAADEGQAHIWMAKTGISKLSRITAKKRFTSFRALEWRYDGQWLRDPDVALERVLAFCPASGKSGNGEAWQSRLQALLASQPRVW